MSALEVLPPLGGVIALVLATWLLGGLRTARLPDADAAAERLRADHPDFAAGATLLAADGSAALVEAADTASIGLVFSVGDRLATRRLGPGDVTAVELVEASDGRRRLELRLADFTGPRVRVPLPADADVERWRARLAQLGARDALRRAS